MNRLLADVHVAFAIVTALRARSIDVLTAQEIGAARLPDEELLKQAVTLGRVLLTQDQDFLAIGAHWQTIGVSFYGINFARQELSIGVIVEGVHLQLHCCSPSELQYRVFHLPLK